MHGCTRTTSKHTSSLSLKSKQRFRMFYSLPVPLSLPKSLPHVLAQHVRFAPLTNGTARCRSVGFLLHVLAQHVRFASLTTNITRCRSVGFLGGDDLHSATTRWLDTSQNSTATFLSAFLARQERLVFAHVFNYNNVADVSSLNVARLRLSFFPHMVHRL